QFQECLGPIKAPRPRRRCPSQARPFLAESSFKAQITLEAHELVREKRVEQRTKHMYKRDARAREKKVRSPVVSNIGSSNFNSNSDNSSQEPKPMENNDRTFKELATSDVGYQPWCIYLIHLLPKFHGLAGEDPYKNLKEFHVPILFNTWGDMKCMFLQKFFSTSITGTIRK
ncbi:hypothetical protein CR513_05014, partial [Mucuna pruriens]